MAGFYNRIFSFPLSSLSVLQAMGSSGGAVRGAHSWLAPVGGHNGALLGSGMLMYPLPSPGILGTPCVRPDWISVRWRHSPILCLYRLLPPVPCTPGSVSMGGEGASSILSSTKHPQCSSGCQRGVGGGAQGGRAWECKQERTSRSPSSDSLGQPQPGCRGPASSSSPSSQDPVCTGALEPGFMAIAHHTARCPQHHPGSWLSSPQHWPSTAQ